MEIRRDRDKDLGRKERGSEREERGVKGVKTERERLTQVEF